MRKKSIVIIIIVILLGVVGFIFFRNRNGSVTARQAEILNIPVKKTVSASGTIKSRFEADLAFPVTGTLLRVNSQEGDYVEEGYVIASLTNVQQTQTAQAAKDARDVAIKDLEIYIENYGTNWDAVGGQDEYLLNVSRLEELLSRAEANYLAARDTIANTYLRAPFDGIIVELTKDVGEVITFSAPMGKIADLENLVFEIEVDQEDFGLLKVGQIAEVVLDSYPEVIFEGTITTLPLFVDESTEEFIIEIDIPQSEETPLLLGMQGDVDIIVGESSATVNSLSFDTLFTDDSGTFIWIVQDNKLQKKYVQSGLEGDIYTEILTDISGLTIVVPNEDEAVVGDKVKIE